MISSDWPQNSLLDSIEFRESGRELSAEFTDFRSHEMEGAIRDFLDERITIIHDDKARACLDRLGEIPRMSTMAIGFVLHKLVEMMPDGLAFLNIGVWHGFSFFAGAVGNAGKRTIGVDNFSEFGGPRDEFLNRFEEFHSEQMEFHDVDFREYLREHHSEPLGVYFFDGPHRYEDQLDGLILAEQFFARGCHVIIDDTNESVVSAAIMEFLRTRWRTYEIVIDKKTAYNGHPTFWNGIMVLRVL